MPHSAPRQRHSAIITYVIAIFDIIVVYYAAILFSRLRYR